MKIVDGLHQGDASWHAHRAQHHNASEAAVMLGLHPDLSRSELLRIRATGIERDVSEFLQRIFDTGHRFEAQARPLAEQIIGEDLYPCVGVAGKLSASFDGLTMDFGTGWEHKWLNNVLRDAMFEGCTGADLPIYHQIQMEQQCMLSGAARVLFTASDWQGEALIEARHCWYTPNPDLRARIVAGWELFEADLANYQPAAPVAPAPVGHAPETLPALRIELTGLVTASNLQEFRDHAIAVFKGINTDLQTDQDFADAERTVKWCGDIETRLAAAKQHALSQTKSIDDLFRAIDAISDEARAKRLELDKLVAARKLAIRGEILQRGKEQVETHYAVINATMGPHRLSVPLHLAGELANAIKGKRTVTSMADAVDAVVANEKIDASQRAEAIRANVSILDAAEHGELFPDRVALCATKSAEDLRNLVAARIADYRQREEKRLDAERERIHKEEEAKARAALAPLPAIAPEPAPTLNPSLSVDAPRTPQPAPVRSAVSPLPRLRLGDINALIAPLAITAEGLAQLGFPAVATERAAKLYAGESRGPILAALIRHLQASEPCRDVAA